MTNYYTIEEIENVTSEIDNEGFIFEESEQHQIVLDSNYIHIKELGVDVYQGSYLLQDEENDFYDDYTIFIFMETGTMNKVYEEGYTSLVAAITNYCHFNQKKVNTDTLKVELI